MDDAIMDLVKRNIISDAELYLKPDKDINQKRMSFKSIN